jgi:hypothetical protein
VRLSSSFDELQRVKREFGEGGWCLFEVTLQDLREPDAVLAERRSQAFPANRLLASATLDRLRHNAYCLVLDGQSYRAPKIKPAAGRTRKLAASLEEGHP